ncbi:hypothetical protein PG997_004266 [Apiospora hydei]|uniref:BHLH domain-containing protein n=1 Tax=Apiospora hydei TaxID=1337664 RepID=A0ABR1X1Q5_9PEZI
MESAYTSTEAALEQLKGPPDRAYLTAMAEAVAHEQADLSPSAPSSPSQKRKRGLPEESSSPDSRRSKRSAPAAPLSDHAEPDNAASYVESAVEAAQAAAAANVSAADFTALQQAAADHHNEPDDAANASSTAAAALGSMYPTIHIPPTTEQTFAAQTANDTEHHHHPYGSAEMMHTPDGLPDTSGGVNQNGMRPTPNADFMSQSGPKPAVGSEEWHKLRKDNHKEVERRRRETINEGINELAKIVPGCEKNKGSILARAVSFITQLKENEAHNLERWTIEKLLTEQAISELSASNDKLKQECDRIYREMNVWKQLAQNAGLKLPQSKEEPSSS